MFGTGDFVRVEIANPTLWGFRLGLLMGVALSKRDDGTFDVVGLVNDEEGAIHSVPVDQFITDYIYDVERDKFVDRSAKELSVPME